MQLSGSLTLSPYSVIVEGGWKFSHAFRVFKTEYSAQSTYLEEEKNSECVSLIKYNAIVPTLHGRRILGGYLHFRVLLQPPNTSVLSTLAAGSEPGHSEPGLERK